MELSLVCRKGHHMHHHYSTYYEIEKHHREDELARKLEQQYWIEQAELSTKKKRPRRWRMLVSIIVGFFA